MKAINSILVTFKIPAIVPITAIIIPSPFPICPLNKILDRYIKAPGISPKIIYRKLNRFRNIKIKIYINSVTIHTIPYIYTNNITL